MAITKCDLLDEELIEMLKAELPEDLPVVFISAVTGYGLTELKDKLWEELNSESNKLQAISEGGSIVHRNRDAEKLSTDFSDWEDDFIEETDDTSDDDFVDYEDYDDEKD